MQLESYRQHYPKIIGAILFCLFASNYLISRGDKPREDFIHVNGTISYLSKEPPFQFNGRKNKKVYLTINEFDRVFEMFVGTDTGDFSPRVNQLEKLKLGDEIDIYFEKTSRTQQEPVNRLLQYLDRNGELIYLRSTADKNIGYFLLGVCGIFFLLLIYLEVKTRKSNTA